jgi:hypothetical protein
MLMSGFGGKYYIRSTYWLGLALHHPVPDAEVPKPPNPPLGLLPLADRLPKRPPVEIELLPVVELFTDELPLEIELPPTVDGSDPKSEPV